MNKRENLELLLKGGSPPWIPFTLDVGGVPGFTDPIQRRFEEETGARDPAEFFDYDFRTFSLKARFGGEDPRAAHRSLPASASVRFDEWGIGHEAEGLEGTYERMHCPLAHVENIRDVERYPIPIIEESPSFPQIADFHGRGYPVFGYAGSIYEWSWWLRGMEAFMMDLLDEPALAEAITRRVTDYTKALACASAAAGIDVLCFYDDAGSQQAMQIAPDLWRRFIKPRWAEVLDAVRAISPGTYFFLHSCGNIAAIVPDVIDLGFHVLHPLQPECLDATRIKREFGSRIACCATVSAQRILPFGKPEEVRAEVRRLKREMGDDRRCILCPSNRIQPETPWENVVAFAEAARQEEE
ncbi:MAG TPA: uroporphyrinogen decarboxylase family protein [Verrucomicrobiae bacterium]|nr:uroporphyrinogen decarboxylase family protein [Verrucomicrobiae bacterium]